jgi:signal transduction histidine kinase
VDDSQVRGGAEAGLRFFGVITASVTHELNNIISTIEQIAGLLEDHLAAVATGQPVDPERMRNIPERIARQTQRASETIERLNEFAHSSDEPHCRFELKGLLASLLKLSERLANLKKVKLDAEYPTDDLWIESNPFLLQQAIFHSLQVSWEVAQPGEVVYVSMRGDGDSAYIVIAGPDRALSGEQDELTYLAGMMTDLSGTAEKTARNGLRVLTLEVPIAPS